MLQQPERIRQQIFMQQRFHEKFHKIVNIFMLRLIDMHLIFYILQLNLIVFIVWNVYFVT